MRKEKKGFGFGYAETSHFISKKCMRKKKVTRLVDFIKNTLQEMPNLPWRTERGPILTTCLLKLVMSTGQHMKKNKAGSPGNLFQNSC